MNFKLAVKNQPKDYPYKQQVIDSMIVTYKQIMHGKILSALVAN